MNSRQIRLELEACRPGHDDLSTPGLETVAQAVRDSLEWAQAYEQSQRVDTAISAALRDVAIPEGLEARLLAAIQAAETNSPAETPVEVESSPALSIARASARESGPSDELGPTCLEHPGPSADLATSLARHPEVSTAPRRWSWLVAAAATVALTIAAWTVPDRVPTAPMVVEHLGIEAVEWSENLTDDWRDLDSLPNQDRPVDRFVRLVPHGWQLTTTPYDSQTIAYDLTRPRGAGYLFVLRPSEIPSDLDAFVNRVSATGGWGAAAWRRRDLVYVLLVEERRQRLEDFLQRSATEVVAWSAPGGSR